MQNSSGSTLRWGQSWRRKARLAVFVLALLCAASGGCAALTFPVSDGVPVRRLPPEIIGESRDEEVTIPLTLLEQQPPSAYLLGPGDVLGIWIEGVTADAPAVPQLFVNTTPPTKEQRRGNPALGQPVTVRPDGKITVPWVDPIDVNGKTLEWVEKRLKQIYTVDKQILKEGKERVFVSLMQPRLTQVLVLRQEALSFINSGLTQVASGKRGTGQLVELPAYENDVLHAMTLSGGMPGLDAYNEIIIFRAAFKNDVERAAVQRELEAVPPGAAPQLSCMLGEVIHIPLRLKPGEHLPVGPQDILLHNGDVVFIEARDKEVYFTGGLLPSTEQTLPRDRTLDVVEAVARTGGTLFNGAFSTSNLSGNLVEAGIGNPSPSQLTVLRRLPNGGRLPIRVDLKKAVCDARENIPVQPGDILLLQERPSEALARYFTQTFLNFSLTYQVLHDRFIDAVFDVSTPQQIPARIGVNSVTAGR
jgi:protein involved in polysaccharide export with SLBB domain